MQHPDKEDLFREDSIRPSSMLRGLQRLLGEYLRSSTQFQVMSDLHLEVGQQYADFDIPTKAPYLILAGDIGRLKDYGPYLEFLRRQCKKYNLVFLVLGNHEFFGSNRPEGLQLARRLANECGCKGKLHVMNRDRVDLDESTGITILGYTLHSKITAEARSIVQTKVNDFKNIKSWTVDDHNSEHRQDVEWLQREIHNIRNRELQPHRNILIITHHAPTVQGSSRPDHLANPWTCAFSTDLLGDKSFADVHWWIFGHTHFTTEFQQGQTNLCSNQRGYVLNGNPLQEQSQGRNKRPFLERSSKSKSSKRGEFDVGKIIQVKQRLET